MKIFFTLFLFFTFASSHAQTEPPIFFPDTIKKFQYYKSGKVKIYDEYLEGVPTIQYSKKIWYTRSGNIILYDSIDAKRDILFIAVFRKDGSPYYELRETTRDYIITYRNRSGEITDIYSGKLNARNIHWQSYKNGIKDRDSIYDRFVATKLDTVRYYENVVEKGKKTIVRQELSKNSRITLENHIRMVYSTDSTLINESLYNFRVKNCGYFIEYYPNGNIKNIGEFDKRGYKNNDWFYFDEEGNVVKRERFYRGSNIFR